MTSSAPPLILGGGLAGSAAAILLARAGVPVILLEQHPGPRHKVCGEFLSIEACDSLCALGLDLPALGAVPVRTVRLAGRQSHTEHALPFIAQSLTRRTLDEALLQLAAASGADVRRGTRVETLDRTSGGAWRVELSGPEATTLTAHDVFIASGKHDLRGLPRPQGAHRGDRALIAFKQYLQLSSSSRQELDGAVELTLFRGGYAGLQLVEGGCANLCLLVEARRYKELGGSWSALLGAMAADSQHLQHRLAGAEPLLDRPLSLSHIPYGFVRRQREGTPGLWYLGDQAAVIPSFSGDGMSIALHTARVATSMYLRQHSASEATQRLAAELRPLVARATVLSRAMLSAPGQALILGATHFVPSLLAGAAACTRIPARLRLGRDPR